MAEPVAKKTKAAPQIVHVVWADSEYSDHTRAGGYGKIEAVFAEDRKRDALILVAEKTFENWETLWYRYPDADREEWEDEKDARRHLMAEPDLQALIYPTFLTCGEDEKLNDFETRCEERSKAGLQIDFTALTDTQLEKLTAYMDAGLTVRGDDSAIQDYLDWEHKEVWHITTMEVRA